MGKGMAVSSTRLGPLLLRPRFVKKPWGGRRIQTLLGRELPDDGPIGESWEVYDRDDGSSPIVGGSQAGATLADVRGDTRYPLMFKILDARETLSVQVHPDGETAVHLGGEEKTECWFVLHAEPGARIYRGFADGVTRADVERALADGTLAELLHSFEPRAGIAGSKEPQSIAGCGESAAGRSFACRVGVTMPIRSGGTIRGGANVVDRLRNRPTGWWWPAPRFTVSWC